MKLKQLLGYSFVALGMALMPLKAQKGESLKLNGTDQCMVIPHHNDFNIGLNESFTITAYIKSSKYTGRAYPRFVAKRAKGKGDNTGYELWGLQDRNHFFANTAPDANGRHGSTTMSEWANQPGSLNTWVHIAFVVDKTKNEMCLYLNGVLGKTSKTKGKNIKGWSVTNPFDVIVGAGMVDATKDFAHYFNGEIDNLRFWKRALTAEEMQADMTADKADKNKLVAEYDFEGISKTGLVKDISGSANVHNGQLMPMILPIKVEQVTGFAGCRNTEPILKLDVNDVSTSPKLKSLKVSMEGTSDVNDVEKIKILLTNSNGEKQVVGEATPATGEILIQLDETKTLTSGKNTFSLCYQIKADAKQGNMLDAKLIELTTSEDVINLSTVGNPAGDREIILGRTRLFASGDYGSKNYRIPAIITAKDGSLIAMTDKRKNNGADLPQDIDVVVRRSTDMGLTWSEPVTVAEGKGYGKGYGDAALVMAKDGTLIATYVGGVGLRGSNGNIGRTYISKSTDNGVTWTAPIDITDQLYGPNCPSNENQRQKWVGVFCASGNGLCTRDGRIMFVAGAKTQGGSLDNYLFYSDDKGTTWNVSAKIKTGGDEAKVVELNNGDLLVSIRHGGAGSGTKPRPWVLSKDGGKTWTESGTWDDVKDPACNGDMIYYTSTKDGYERNRLLHSIPYSTRGQRENVSVLISYDEGKTWTKRKLVSKGSSAYSSICKLQDGSIGVYVEEGDPNAYEMYFLRFSLDWLTNGDDQYNAPNKKGLESPIFTPDPKKEYLDEVDVTITHPTEGITLYYTLDGTEPTRESPVYSAPLKLMKSTTIKVYAEKKGEVPSSVVTVRYEIKSSEGQTTAVEALDSESVKIYIAQDGLHVEGLATAQLSLYNLAGQLIQSFSVNGSSVQPLNLTKGIYLLKVQTPQGKKVYKLSL